MEDNRVRVWLGSATIVAAVATAGSLYFSLGLGLIPCELCWYQRILMYPLVVVLGVAVVEGRPRVYRTVLPLSLTGIAIAGYHSWLQFASASSSCTLTAASCSTVQYRILGLSIPNLSLIAFVLITAGVGLVLFRTRAGSPS